jgi:hypothetical protein
MVFAFMAASALLRDHRLTPTSGGTKQCIARTNVTPLPPFALYTAFPGADYDGGSDALTWHRGTAPLGIHISASHVHHDELYAMV